MACPAPAPNTANPTSPALASRQQTRVETDLIAGPAAANPPLPIAIALVALSIIGPFIFVADGTPSLLLGFAAVAVALAGMLTMVAAVRAQLHRRADTASRRRVGITSLGITLYPTRSEADNRHFAWDNIGTAQLMPAAFVIDTRASAVKPERYVLRFGKLITPRDDIVSALAKYRRLNEANKR
jgi:hypothetical protein